MQYSTVERDFVKRTLILLKQYDQYVIPKTGADDRYEVTLLLNCLLGLIVLPFEYSKREQSEPQYPQVVLNNEIQISEVSSSWGLANIQIFRLKLDGKKVQPQELTFRKMIALTRHRIAHAQFEDGGGQKKPRGLSVTYGVDKNNPIESMILQVNFVNEYRNKVEFEASIPVDDLRIFACMVAEWFLSRLENKVSKSKVNASV